MKKSRIIKIAALTVVLALLSGCGSKQFDTQKMTDSGEAQSYWNIFNRWITKAGNGYYYWTQEFNETAGELYMLKYMDADTMATTYVCGKAECRHNDYSCNAYFNPTQYQTSNIYYYREKLYLIEMDEKTQYDYLTQVAPDGSTRTRLFEIGPHYDNYVLAFYDTAAYIYQRSGSNGTDIQKIRRRSLDGKEDENIYEGSPDIMINAVKVYGDKVYFTVMEIITNREKKEISFGEQGIFAYDPKTKETSQVVKAAVSDFTIDTGSSLLYYYVIGDGLYKSTLNADTKQQIYKTEAELNDIAQISTDGRYIYLSNDLNDMMSEKFSVDHYLWVFDSEGKQVNKIPAPGSFCVLFGDERYMFGKAKFGTGHNITYIKKSEIETAAEWTTIY